MPQPMTAAQIFNRLKASPKRVVVAGITYYVVEGDLFLDETELFAYSTRRAALQLRAGSGQPMQRKGLVAMTNDEGRIIRWRKGLLLTYAVLRSTFAGNEQYETVAAAMHQATAGWEGICGVNFEHLQSLDEGSSAEQEKAIFRVAGHDGHGQYIAVAFFPNHPSSRRTLFIDPSYFLPDLGFDQTGVLRHELGHVLGFRHEHIRSNAPAVCPDEPLEHTINLTDYDPRSVMHYFCGGVGSKDLAFTDADRRGARMVYGPPDLEMDYHP
jgi:hypothetical protein